MYFIINKEQYAYIYTGYNDYVIKTLNNKKKIKNEYIFLKYLFDININKYTNNTECGDLFIQLKQ